IDQIVQTRGEAAVPALLEALRGQDGRLKWAALRSLVTLGAKAKSAVPVLVKELERGVKEQDLGAPGPLREALAAIGPPAVSERMKLLKSENRVLRAEAAAALSEMKPRPAEAVPALLALLKTSDDDARESAREALGRIAPTIVPVVWEMITDHDPRLRA